MSQILLLGEDIDLASEIRQIMNDKNHKLCVVHDMEYAIKFLKNEPEVDLIVVNGDSIFSGWNYAIKVLTNSGKFDTSKILPVCFWGSVPKYNEFVENLKSIPMVLMLDDYKRIEEKAKRYGIKECFRCTDEHSNFNKQGFIAVLDKYLK